MRSVIPTKSPSTLSGLQSAGLIAGALALATLYVQAKTCTVERDHPPEGKFI